MTTEAIAIRVADDQDRVIDVLTRAFVADPAARWAYPDEQQYHRYFPEFIRMFAEKALAQQTVYCIDGFLGVAVWLPPGIHPDEEALATMIEGSVTEAEREHVGTSMAQMGQHHPPEPHWYLPLIGVVPSRHRGGLGSALMRHALGACDRDGRPAYLEATSAESMTLYRRHGFRQIGTIQAGRSPQIYPMLREPR